MCRKRTHSFPEQNSPLIIISVKTYCYLLWHSYCVFLIIVSVHETFPAVFSGVIMLKHDVQILLRNLFIYIFWMIILLAVREVYSEDLWKNWEFYEVPDRVPKQIVIDNENRKWIVASNGVQVFNGEEWIKYTKSNSGLPYYKINCIKLDRENNMWFGTDKGAARFDGETWQILDTSTSGIAADRVVDMAFDNDGGIWFTSSLTVSHFDGAVWKTYLTDIENSYAISCITVDFNNNPWFGMYRSGIKRFDGSSWRTYNNNNSGIASDFVTTVEITPDEGKLVIGSKGRISEFDGLLWKSWSAGRNGDISSGDVLKIDFDSNGLTWIATEQGFSCCDGETWASFSYNDIPVIEGDSDSDIKVRGLAIDKEDTVWLLTNKGLYRYTPEFIQINGSFEDEIYNPGESIDLIWQSSRIQDVKIEYNINDEDTWQKIESSLNAVLKKYVYTLPFDIIPQEYYSLKMTIRISSADSPELSDEIFFYVEEKDLRESFVTYTPDNSGIISDSASIIYEDNSGVIWFVSGKGVSRYDGSSWEAFTTENSGLVSNDISSIYEDKKGGIWLLSNEGVSGYDGTNWTTFTTENSGLINDYVKHMASTPDGSLWFGTNDGLYEFDGEHWETWFEGESIMYLAVGRNGRVFTFFHRFEPETEKVACKWHAPHEWEIVSFDGEKWVRETKEYSTINVIGTDPDGYLWFNTFENKMIKYDGIRWYINECPPEVFWVKKTGIEGCITWGSDGTIWIDDNKSLYSFNGKEWENYSYANSFSPGSMSVASDGSVWSVSRNKGITVLNGAYWKTYLNDYGCPFYNINTIFVDSHNMKWISCSEGIVRFDDESIIQTKIVDNPEEITLMRNFPNPFNSATTISFSLPSSGFSELVVYNIMGQKVRTLLADNQMAGQYSVVWDGRDINGVPVSSGTYITSLKSGSTTWAGKMLLIK